MTYNSYNSENKDDGGEISPLVNNSAAGDETMQHTTGDEVVALITECRKQNVMYKNILCLESFAWEIQL